MQLKFVPIKELATPLKQKSFEKSNLKFKSTSLEQNSQLTYLKSVQLKDDLSNQITIELNVIKFSELFWLKPLNHVLALYVLCETNEGIAIVDIHAAHERVKYEDLIEKYQKSKIELQEMLQPITFKLTREQIALIEDLLPQLQSLGINFELFGGNTYLLRRLPITMDLIKTEEDILDFLDDIKNEIPKTKSLDDRIDLIIKKMACHSVVRSGETIPLNKIFSILKQLSTCKKPFTCPHGRPTIIKISQKELEKEFKRII